MVTLLGVRLTSLLVLYLRCLSERISRTCALWHRLMPILKIAGVPSMRCPTEQIQCVLDKTSRDDNARAFGPS